MPTTDVRGRRPWKTSAEDGPWTVCGRRLRKNLGYKGCSRSAGQWPEWPHEGSWEAQVAGRNAYRNHVRFCKRFCQRSVSVLSAFAPLRDAKEVPGRAPRSTGKPKLLAEMLTEIMCVSVSVSVSVRAGFSCRISRNCTFTNSH